MTCAAGTAELRVDGLSKRFAGGAAVLSDVSFAVARGETVALLGANGAGKSTLLRCCLRLIEPDAGRIRLLGSDPRALKAAELRRLRARVGFIFQRHNLVPRLPALSNVLHGALARGGGMRAWFHEAAPRALRTEALECLDRVGLAAFAEHRADRLSGGQSQRVAVARALMQRAEMLFADEPVASLDPAAGEEVMELFRDLVRRAGLTLVFTTHNLRHALDYADRIVALRGGRVEIDAPSRELDQGALRAFYG
ncbi:MAG: ATP-binding cassette domain-containing protein [Alphaproteobacteria bacterium]|nr:ATP-binding cassette domain-containing protein [Alphaproteobacteria bacterium]